jgi:predicted enzyme related to lactoylglutathione lyase
LILLNPLKSGFFYLFTSRNLKYKRTKQFNTEEHSMLVQKYAETMIGSKNLPATAEFYKKFLGMEVSNPGDGQSFMILADPKTNQRLCIVADPRIQNAVPSIETTNFDMTLTEFTAQGGKVVDQNTYPTMKVATVQDPDGRQLCIWQTIN